MLVSSFTFIIVDSSYYLLSQIIYNPSHDVYSFRSIYIYIVRSDCIFGVESSEKFSSLRSIFLSSLMTNVIERIFNRQEYRIMLNLFGYYDRRISFSQS